jgi:hypothetical protein
MRCPRLRHAVGQLAAKPVHQVVDAFRSPPREPGLAGQVHEHRRSVQIGYREVGALRAQLPQVLPVESVQLVGDVDPPGAAALHAGPGRVVARNHLDERGVAAAGVPIAMLKS